METASLQGVCSAGISALQYACMAGGQRRARACARGHERAAVAAVQAHAVRGPGLQRRFDANFLRWMLSDGAGAFLVSHAPNPEGLTLKVKWIHLKSFSGDFPVCMQVGLPGEEPAHLATSTTRRSPRPRRRAPSSCARTSASCPISSTWASTSTRRWSSAGSSIPPRSAISSATTPRRSSHPWWRSSFDKLTSASRRSAGTATWPARQHRRGVDLHHARGVLEDSAAEARRADPLLRAGVRTVHGRVHASRGGGRRGSRRRRRPSVPIRPNAADRPAPPVVSTALQQLAQVWHDYRSRAHRTPLVQKILKGALSREDYLRWMSCWIPQVREGSGWMRTAAARFEEPFLAAAAGGGPCPRRAPGLQHPVRGLQVAGGQGRVH